MTHLAVRLTGRIAYLPAPSSALSTPSAYPTHLAARLMRHVAACAPTHANALGTPDAAPTLRAERGESVHVRRSMRVAHDAVRHATHLIHHVHRFADLVKRCIGDLVRAAIAFVDHFQNVVLLVFQFTTTFANWRKIIVNAFGHIFLQCT